jgi:heterodisulfide reductase subunit C
MQIVQQIIFAILAIASIGFFSLKVRQIRRNIRLGRDEDLSDNKGQRWRNVLLIAFGQQKMFRKPFVALLHLFVYAGFIIINIEVLEIIIDGLAGTHRIFARSMGGLYQFLINAFEVLALLVLVSCAIFLARRNFTRIWRLRSGELDGWPRSDANIILVTEIVLMSLFLLMNASDTILQARNADHYNENLTGNFVFSQYLHPLLTGMSDDTLVGVERGTWWLHITGILAFLNYLAYSKHLHIILAFPNTYYARLQPQGKMENMPSVQNEVLYALQPELAPAAGEGEPPKKFGAKDITDLSWKNLMDAYTCTECGRCSAVCPATQTGKLLSPRKIMMDTRDRMEEVGRNLNKNKSFEEDGRSLLHDYISKEELLACTSCNHCVQECPVSISPLDIIYQLRRYLVMEESNTTPEWAAMFSNVENNFAPWKFSPDDRDKWTTEV